VVAETLAAAALITREYVPAAAPGEPRISASKSSMVFSSHLSSPVSDVVVN
jgi:hypothetical protein